MGRPLRRESRCYQWPSCASLNIDIEMPKNFRSAIVAVGMIFVSLALAGCAGPATDDTSAPATVSSSQVPPTPAATTTRSPQTPDTLARDANNNPTWPVVIVGDVSFAIELAQTSEQLARGLSGRGSLAQGTGMLFVHDTEERYTFWMKDMRFPLDMLWIAADCTLADISAQVPPPEPDQSDRSLPLFSPDTQVLHVLEINAGVASSSGISIGDAVRFAGSLEGRYGC